jgi:hypothetical protein
MQILESDGGAGARLCVPGEIYSDIYSKRLLHMLSRAQLWRILNRPDKPPKSVMPFNPAPLMRCDDSALFDAIFSPWRIHASRMKRRTKNAQRQTTFVTV